jgi:hypothetical protein
LSSTVPTAFWWIPTPDCFTHKTAHGTPWAVFFFQFFCLFFQFSDPFYERIIHGTVFIALFDICCKILPERPDLFFKLCDFFCINIFSFFESTHFPGDFLQAFPQFSIFCLGLFDCKIRGIAAGLQGIDPLLQFFSVLFGADKFLF